MISRQIHEGSTIGGGCSRTLLFVEVIYHFPYRFCGHLGLYCDVVVDDAMRAQRMPQNVVYYLCRDSQLKGMLREGFPSRVKD